MSDLDRLDVMTPFDVQAVFIQDELDRPDVAELVWHLSTARWQGKWVVRSLIGTYLTMLLRPPNYKKFWLCDTEEQAMAAARAWIEARLRDET